MRLSNGDKTEILLRRLIERKAEAGAAEAKLRKQVKTDFSRASTGIGAAMMKDVEGTPDPEERARRKAYIAEVLARTELPASMKAFLKAKKWL